jgi:hypothetical protein
MKLPLSLAAALGSAVATSAIALAIISEVGVTNQPEHDTLGGHYQQHCGTNSV